MPRARCFVAGCPRAAEFRFDVNYGVRRYPLLVNVCADHLRRSIEAAMKLQEVRGDSDISLLVVRLGQPTKPLAAPRPARR